jgi:hypothetical protein
MKSYKRIILTAFVILAFALVPFIVDAEKSYLVYSLVRHGTWLPVTPARSALDSTRFLVSGPIRQP